MHVCMIHQDKKKKVSLLTRYLDMSEKDGVIGRRRFITRYTTTLYIHQHTMNNMGKNAYQLQMIGLR